MKSFIEEYKAGGLIKFRVRARKVVDGKTVKVHVGVFSTREEAERAAAAAHAIVSDSHHRVGAYLEKVLERMEAKPSYWSIYRTHILTDEIAQRHVSVVTSPELRAFFVRLQNKNATRVTTVRKDSVRETTTKVLDRKLSYRTCENAFNLIRVMFRWAKTDGIVQTLPTEDIILPRKKTTKTHGLALALPEQKALLDAIDGPEKFMVAFAMYTGLRAWELCALHWQDVHLGRAPHMWVRYGGKPTALANGQQIFPPTKGGNPRRVPLIPAALQALKAWRRASKAWFVESVGPRHDYLVFPTREYQVRDGVHILRWERWKKVIAKSGIPSRMRWHDLRHTCGTSLLHGWWGQKWSLKEVQTYLGHAESSTTEAYLHESDETMDANARATAGGHIELDKELEASEAEPKKKTHSGGGGGTGGAVPHNLPHGNFDEEANSLILLEPPWGFEPQTYGLRKHRPSESNQEVSADFATSFAPSSPHALAARGAALAFDVAVMSTDVQRVFVALEGLLYAVADLAERESAYAHLNSIVQGVRGARTAGRDQFALTLARSLVTELAASEAPASAPIAKLGA